ncbi:MAG: class I SAM-dependent methyltransferase [Polyangiaceae bacterium]|nr:class I SAM-dependent methyltransferase [Polyangiaceae bacterium]
MVSAKRGAVAAPRRAAPRGAGGASELDRALAEALPRVAPRASPAAAEGIRAFLHLLSEWAPRVDLTAARDPRELVDLFVADAALLAEAARDASGERWVDVGTGAGAPGIVLALLAPALRVTLVEPRAKRAAFLRTVIGRLGLDRVSLVPARSEVVSPRSFDVAVSRATLPPPEWLREGARLAPAVWVLLARGDAPALAGWRVAVEHEYVWPLTGVARRALRYVPE